MEKRLCDNDRPNQASQRSCFPTNERMPPSSFCDQIHENSRSTSHRSSRSLCAGSHSLPLKSKSQTRIDKRNRRIGEASEEDKTNSCEPFWAVDRIVLKARETPGNAETVGKAVIEEAEKMADEDVETNRKIGEQGSALLEDDDVILTHCNAGALATVDYGTALGVIRAAWEKGKKVKVFATETRPKLQGARLTAYELKRDGVPVTLITDSMAGYVMYNGLVDKVIVGADRITQDAVINKIGTYTNAVSAKDHGIPFYVAAPKSTFDLTHKSTDIIIEERNPDEVTHINSRRITPEGVKVLNPAFDVTPLKYVTAIICETGVLSGDDLGKLAANL